MVSRHADATAVLKGEAWTRPPSHGVGYLDLDDAQPAGFSQRVVAGFLTHLVPPHHARLRGLVSHEFGPRRVEGLRASVERLADRLLDDVADVGETDLMTSYAYPLPSIVIGEILGLPPEADGLVRAWTASLVRLLAVDAGDADREEADRAAGALAEYLLDVVAFRRTSPGDDLLSDLVHAGNEALSDSELIVLSLELAAAGHETTVNLIGSGALTLLERRTQLDRLTRDWSLLRSTVEECLRFRPPLRSALPWVARYDTRLSGDDVAQGEKIAIWIVAANRDADVFEDPDEFDVGRAPNPHLAFSAGPHYCLGAALARLEGEIALRRLFTRWPDLALATDTVRWRDLFTIQELASLPVAWNVR